VIQLQIATLKMPRASSQHRGERSKQTRGLLKLFSNLCIF